jgi:hypothetical protein
MPRRYTPLLFSLLVALGLFAASVACGSNNDVHKVTVTLKDGSITVDPPSVPKGPVEFTIKNEGQKKHDLLIIKTSTAPDKLPTQSDGSVDKGGADVDVKHEVPEIDGGDDTSRTYDLDPGTYVLVSNVVQDANGVKTADYSSGMNAAFTVTEGSGSPSASATTAATGSQTPTPRASGSTPTATP